MTATTLTSSDAATAMGHRRNLELLLMMVVIHSLLRKEGANDDDDAQLEQMKEMVTEFSMAINRRDQSAVSRELLLAVTQRLLDAQLRLLDDGGEDEARDEVSSSASDHQLMLDNTAAAKKKEKTAAAAKKKRNKRNKAAAKQKGTKLASWLGGGIISLLMMATFGFGSITTFNVALSLIHQTDGSSEGKAPPTLPPSTSTYLRQRDLQSSNMASMSPATASVSPFAAVVQAPMFSPAAVSNRPMNSVDESALSTCFDTRNWEDIDGFECKWYEENDEPGCPNEGSLYDGGMGVANDNCCHCGGGTQTLPPTTSPKPSISPTKSAPPSSSPKPSSSPTKSDTPSSSPSSTPTSSPSSSPSICTDTEGWYDERGYDCVWYEVVDVPGCPHYGSQTAHQESPAQGTANDICCYCKNDVVSTLSPTKAPSSSGTCVDTAGWKNKDGTGCEWYQKFDDPGCPQYGNDYVGDMGPAAENCCYCKDPTCEDYKWKCQYSNTENWWTVNPDYVKSKCDKAASCSCEAADYVKIVTLYLFGGSNETVGLYNECKCDFWLRVCEEIRGGDACDYAAEYCCGDYKYRDGRTEAFRYLNSPLCFCDFFNYAQKEFGHTLKPKALNIINKEFLNPCGQFEDTWDSSTYNQKDSLEVIYNATNGQNWKNYDGWMTGEDYDSHCQWYGITCDVEGFVIGIDLRDNNLVGKFPVYTGNLDYTDCVNNWEWTKYGLAKLYKLETLDLSDNKLTGTIEYAPLYNLHALTHFDVSGNQLSGEVEALVAPSLTYAGFSNNQFTSMRRFQKYKVSPLQTLRYCDVSNNAIQQNATDLLENIPPNIEQFIASNNKIYGSLPESLNNLQKLRQFNMASNALSGELPVFADSILSLQELDVSNQTNGFTGSIPEDIWRSLSLKILNLAGNRLEGTIPSLVGDLALLEVFDLSNNRLDSSIPPELGMLEGSLKRLGLSNNTLSGTIPSQIGQLQGASVLLKGNSFHNDSTAPLSLCVEREVKEFDLTDDTTLCPPERNALSDFYVSAKGAEWTDRSKWLDEYASYCDWKGVDCDNNKSHVTKLQLSNNGLSGRLSKSIGNFTFIEVLDLSDNDIKGSIPAELGLLKNLKHLRLSYNAFTGAAPEGLGEMKGLQLLQLQSNRITKMPNIPRLNDSLYNKSTFVTDCGVPSDFDEALKCESCTMCCNANDDCYPQEKTPVQKMGLEGYGTFAALVFGCFIVLCCMVALLLYKYDKRKNRGITLTMAMETRIKEDDEYALSKIGKDSVYSYFVTDKVFGWIAALATLGIQVGILVAFILASEANLQDDTIDVQFTWKCPRDTHVCKDKADFTDAGWAIFCLLMVAFLAKDMISGSKLIYHSAKIRHPLGSRIRYFFGGMILCSITLFALYVSTVYNKAIATSNTEIILNSVIVLFIMDIDEWIFSDLEAINKKWTAHSAESEGTNTEEAGNNGAIIDEMKEEIALQKEQIALQREQIASHQEQIAAHQEEMGMLHEAVQKIQEWQAAASITSDSESVFDCQGGTNARQTEQVDEITMPFEAEQNMQESQAASAHTSDLEGDNDTDKDLRE